MSVRSEFEALVELKHLHFGARVEAVVKFENGASGLLREFIDTPAVQRWPELVEYVSTSMPTENYYAACWTFQCAQELKTMVPDNDMFKCGYFAFAYADANFATVSLKDGKVYTMRGPECPIYEAESLTDFIRKLREEFIAMTQDEG